MSEGILIVESATANRGDKAIQKSVAALVGETPTAQDFNRCIAQLVEHHILDVKVTGSTPVTPETLRVASLIGRTLYIKFSMRVRVPYYPPNFPMRMEERKILAK